MGGVAFGNEAGDAGSFWSIAFLSPTWELILFSKLKSQWLYIANKALFAHNYFIQSYREKNSKTNYAFKAFMFGKIITVILCMKVCTKETAVRHNLFDLCVVEYLGE